MAYELFYIAKSNSQTLNDVEVSFYKKTELINLTPLEVANELVKVVEGTPDSAFTIPPLPTPPSISFTKGVSGGKHFVNFLIGSSVNEGDTFTIKFRGPVFNGSDYNVSATYVAKASDTANTVANFMVTLIGGQLSGHPAIVEYQATNRINVVNQQQGGGLAGGAYPYEQISATAVANPKPTRPHATPYVAFPYTSQYKNNSFFLYVDKNFTPVVLASSNGQGNNPTIQIASTLPINNHKLYIITVGSSIKPGNTYTLTVQGATMTYTVPAAQITRDLKLLGIEYSNTGDDSLWSCLCSSEIKIFMQFKPQDPLDYSTFLTEYYDDWKIEVKINDVSLFIGYLMPDEGEAQFKDKPYTISLKATDGLGLLKTVPFVDLDGADFAQCGDTLHTLITYIASALKQTDLELPIRTFCSIYNVAMDNRFEDITNDLFHQVKVSSKTLLKSSTEYVSCYEALEIMLKDNFRVYQTEGYWNVHRIDEHRNTIQGTFLLSMPQMEQKQVEGKFSIPIAR